MASAVDVTIADKWDLLEALYKHGSDIDILCEHLPNWTRSQIEQTLKRFRFRAIRNLQKEENEGKAAALNQWYKVTENLHQLQGSTNSPWWRTGRAKGTDEPKDHSPVLSQALKYAALFEDHYQGSSPDDPNYSEIYMYLSQIVAGKEPTQISPGSAAKVLEMLDRVKNVLYSSSTMDYANYFLNLDLSYLPSKEAGGESSNKKMGNSSRLGEASSSQACPLFEEEEEEEDEAEEISMSLKPDDPYYEVKKETLLKKIKAKQLEIIPQVSSVPGFNPLEIPAELLVKPPATALEPHSF
ncbi:uncharacterized protein LOC135227066 [Macrobrachium nipponense]|uniref:uncharacterized protein LOC135227066 n=1 Tax=Macrobrachium nipponense TaxID=159736 RepID=UPI0030C8C1A1